MSWPSVKLSDVLEFHRGITFKPEDKVEIFSPYSVVCMRTKNVQEQLDESDIVAVPESFVKRDELYLQEGDLLISSANSWNLVGKVVRIPQLNYRATAGGFISILRPLKQLIDPDYLYRFIGSDEQQHKIRHLGRQTTNISNLDRKRFLDLRIPLPPLSIQKQIAAVLEKADNLRQQSQQMEQELNSLAQSVFFDMFGDSLKNKKKWVSKTVLDVSRKVTDGTHQTPEWSDSGIPFLFISNIRDGEVNFDTKKFITLECFKELTKTTPIEPDDILYTTVGSYGHVALVKSSFPEFCFQRHIAHIKPDPEKILPEFLYYQLQSQGCKHQADNLVRGIAQKTLNLKDLKSIRIIIPPIELQKEYVLKVSVLSRFKHLNKVESLDLKLFFESLMQRAFKDELDLKNVV